MMMPAESASTMKPVKAAPGRGGARAAGRGLRGAAVCVCVCVCGSGARRVKGRGVARRQRGQGWREGIEGRGVAPRHRGQRGGAKAERAERAPVLAEASVLARTKYQLATPPLVIHILLPLSTQSFPFLTADVFAAPTSDPAPGSVTQ